MKAIADHLRSYNHLHGHYPTNDEGLAPIRHLLKDDHRQNLQWNRHYPSTRNFPLTIWGEPFIYENRRGLDPMKFSNSGATHDRKRIYSVQVDKGIYVWSLGAKRAQHTYDTWNPKLRVATRGCVAIALAFVLCYLVMTVRVIVLAGRYGENSSLFGFVSWVLVRDGLLSIFTAAICFPVITGPTCYEGCRFARRTPKLTNDYVALAKKYHERGIIGDDAYRKIAEAAKSNAF
jgi:hypothetical protein